MDFSGISLAHWLLCFGFNDLGKSKDTIQWCSEFMTEAGEEV